MANSFENVSSHGPGHLIAIDLLPQSHTVAQIGAEVGLALIYPYLFIHVVF